MVPGSQPAPPRLMPRCLAVQSNTVAGVPWGVLIRGWGAGPALVGRAALDHRGGVGDQLADDFDRLRRRGDDGHQTVHQRDHRCAHRRIEDVEIRMRHDP